MHLPEAIRALQSGKLPRKSGLTLIRHGTQYDLTVQAESFSISAAKIHVDEEADPHDTDARIDAIREMNETLDLLPTVQLFLQPENSRQGLEERNARHPKLVEFGQSRQLAPKSSRLVTVRK